MGRARTTWAYLLASFITIATTRASTARPTVPLLRWILSQLCRQADYVPHSIRELVREGPCQGLRALLKCLGDMLERFRSVRKFFDALDERTKPRTVLLASLKSIATEAIFERIRLVVASREYEDIKQSLRGIAQHHQHIEAIRPPPTSPEVERALETFPDTLDETYKRKEFHHEIWHNFFSRNPQVLVEAAPSAPGTGSSSQWNILFNESVMQETLGCLISVPNPPETFSSTVTGRPKFNTIQIAQFTVKEYFLSDRISSGPHVILWVSPDECCTAPFRYAFLESPRFCGEFIPDDPAPSDSTHGG
ncbi:hypothetical protein DL769_011567 [Monosporascus sp. CRB-8-3]|nr:hypothetical protein DL769_011567 [Monosporascus sp. CRB-8-3]